MNSAFMRSLRCFLALVLATLELVQLCSCVQSATRLTRDDLLVVFPTYYKRIGLVNVSRIWRKGVRTHVVVDNEADLAALRREGTAHNESFSSTPNFPGMPSSLRHVLSPVLAHQAVWGRYKWMLLGDDDTLWSIPAVLSMLEGAQLPYSAPVAMTDFTTRIKCSPEGRRAVFVQATDPRCQPCPAVATGLAAGWRHVCPCVLSPQVAEGVLPECPRDGQGRTIFYGGAGVVLSWGLVQQLAAGRRAQPDPGMSDDTAPNYYTIAFSNLSRFGDDIMSEALRRYGVGFTSPPLAPPAAALSSIGRAGSLLWAGVAGLMGKRTQLLQRKRLFGSFSVYNERASLDELLQRHQEAARLDPGPVRTMVSAHVRSPGVTLERYQEVVIQLDKLMSSLWL